MAEDDLTINVWVGNLGRYNEGTLIGGWLRLPVDEQRIDRFLTEQVGLTLDAQEALSTRSTASSITSTMACSPRSTTGLANTRTSTP